MVSVLMDRNFGQGGYMYGPANSQNLDGNSAAWARKRTHESKLAEARRLTQAIEQQNQRIAANLEGVELNLCQLEQQTQPPVRE